VVLTRALEKRSLRRVRQYVCASGLHWRVSVSVLGTVSIQAQHLVSASETRILDLALTFAYLAWIVRMPLEGARSAVLRLKADYQSSFVMSH
jgi:hypothetical protein